jgi:hypothetical protein
LKKTGFLNITPSKNQSATGGPPAEAGGMATGTIRKCVSLSASTVLLHLLPLRRTSFLKSLMLTTIRVPSAMGVKIMYKTSEGSPSTQNRGMTVMMRMYSILVLRNLKLKRVTLHVLHLWHYLLNAALGLVIRLDIHNNGNTPSIPNKPILSPHVFEAVMV